MARARECTSPVAEILARWPTPRPRACRHLLLSTSRCSPRSRRRIRGAQAARPQTPLPLHPAKVEWSAEAVASAVLALAKLPDNAVSDLVLHDFFGHAPFREGDRARRGCPAGCGGCRPRSSARRRARGRARAAAAHDARVTELEPLREARWTREALPIEPLRNGLQELQRQWSHTDDGTWPAAEREAWFALMQRLALEAEARRAAAPPLLLPTAAELEDAVGDNDVAPNRETGMGFGGRVRGDMPRCTRGLGAARARRARCARASCRRASVGCGRA